MLILGIFNAHNSGVTLLKDNQIIYASAEERFSREKFTRTFPRKSIENCSNNRSFKQLAHLLKCYPFTHRSRDVIKKIGQLSECRSLLSYQKQLKSA